MKTTLPDSAVPDSDATGFGAPGATPLDAELAEELLALDAAGLRRRIRECDGPAGPHAVVGGRRVLVLASNDYCDLARDERVVAAATAAARRWGAGSGGARLTTGSQPPHTALERRIAEFKHTEDALTFPAGYMANVGTIAALCRRGDLVLSDELNHASIIDGCRLSRADVRVYPHGDLDALGRELAAESGRRRRILAVSDAVFSMDGDLLDLPRFVELCRAHGAISMIDEAHATGVVGRCGRGLCEHFGCPHPDVLMGTLSKALGAAGGYVAGSKVLVDFLRNKARAFVFSTSTPAPIAAAATAAIDILENEPWRAEKARSNAAFFANALRERGIPSFTQSAIVPVVVGDETAAVRASEALLADGIWIPAIRYPTVARGTARLRASVMSTHSVEELAAAAESIARAMTAARG